MRAITIILSDDNQNPDVNTLEDIFDFILNELEASGIGAYMNIQEINTDKEITE